MNTYLTESYIKEAVEMKAMIDEMTAAFKVMQANIQAAMDENELKEIYAGYHSVKLTHYTQTTFDKKTMMADHPEIDFSKYESKSPRARMTLK